MKIVLSVFESVRSGSLRRIGNDLHDLHDFLICLVALFSLIIILRVKVILLFCSLEGMVPLMC